MSSSGISGSYGSSIFAFIMIFKNTIFTILLSMLTVSILTSVIVFNPYIYL